MGVSTMTGGGTPAEENWTTAAAELLESAAPVLPVHTSCVVIGQRAFKVSKNRRPKASSGLTR